MTTQQAIPPDYITENTETDITVITERLKDLAKDRQSFFRDDGDDEVFRDDYAALCGAVAILESLSVSQETKGDLLAAELTDISKADDIGQRLNWRKTTQ